MVTKEKSRPSEETRQKTQTLDMTWVDINKCAFVRYSDQVSITGEDANGNPFKLMLGPEAIALIRQAGHNLNQLKVMTT